MKNRRFGSFSLLLLMIAFFLPALAAAQPPTATRVSVFNFGTVNIEASGYGTTVTNMLTTSLQSEASLNLMDRKELEAFLSLNDLQQNDHLENVIQIGTRLGLNVIVVGNVQKRGRSSPSSARWYIEQKRVIFQTQVRALGDAGLPGRSPKLGSMIVSAIAENASRPPEDKPAMRDRQCQKRSGTCVSPELGGSPTRRPQVTSSSEAPRRPVLRQDRPDDAPRISRPGPERNRTYYYKIRSFNQQGSRATFPP